jgi:hypothetical protein
MLGSHGKQPHRGRPRIAAAAGQKKTLSIRVSAVLAERLDSIAREKGQPLSHEAEHRLEQSFDPALGGPRTRALLRSLAAIIELEGYGDEWLDDRDAFNVVADRWSNWLNERRQQLDPADGEEQRRELAQLEQLIAGASPDGASWLKRQAELLAGNSRIDPEVRAGYARLAAAERGEGSSNG